MENRYARYAEQPLQEERPFDFHTSNICRSTTFHIKSIRCAARRAFLFAQTNDEWQAEPIRFFGASALFRISSASFLPILFWQDRKEWARRAAVTALIIAPRLRCIRNAPPEASGATKMKKPHIRADKRGRRRNNEKVLW